VARAAKRGGHNADEYAIEAEDKIDNLYILSEAE
jgi:hypothetical protein